MPNQAGSTQAKLLIVDDKAANLDLLREMLAPLGHQIFFATSGAKALEIATSVVPDLVLLAYSPPSSCSQGSLLSLGFSQSVLCFSSLCFLGFSC